MENTTAVWEQNANIRPAPISWQEIKKVRHKAEKPLLILSVIITVVGYFLITVGVIGLTIEPELTVEAGLVEGDMLALYGIIAAPFLLIFALYNIFARTRAYSIRVTEKNFPEIYHKSVEFAERLGLKKVPPVYIQQQNGKINAFAAAVFGKRYAKLHAELVDVAYLHNDFETVYFVLAHEFGHIYLKHVTIPFNIFTFLARMIPVYGSMFSRAKEFSCDRIAQLLANSNGAREMMLLPAGRHLYRHIDLDDYFETLKKESGIFLWYVNMMASHPVPVKRLAALIDPEKKSGKLLFGT